MKLDVLRILLIIGAILCFTQVKAQKVSGKVSDKNGPLDGVTVLELGTINKTQTDFGGNFTINNLGANATLIFRYSGYYSKQIAVEGKSTINVMLYENLNDLIAVNYENPDNVPKFPWTPPSPSAKTVIPSTAFTSCENLGDLNDILVKALTDQEYVDRSYFLVPATHINGFALATQLEQIDEDGIPKKIPHRWNINLINQKFSFKEYITALFFSNPGYFRVIVVIITDKPFSANNPPVDRKTAISWIQDGINSFPKILRNVEYTDDHIVSALIYEYELAENKAEANLMIPSKYSAKDHLTKSQLWNELLE